MSAEFLPDPVSVAAISDAACRACANVQTPGTAGPKSGSTRPRSSLLHRPVRGSRWMRLIAHIYRLYFSTWRTRVLLPDGTSVSPAEYLYRADIFAHSERESLVLACILDFSPFTVLVAPGRDGDHATAALESIGCRVVRGSSRRDGVSGIIKLTHALLSGPEPAAICVDGPLGPGGRVKEGVLFCSQVSGRPVVAVATAARWRIIFPRTWSQIFLPLPFSKVVISTGEELHVPPHASRQELARRLGFQLERERARAEAAVRKHWPRSHRGTEYIR